MKVKKVLNQKSDPKVVQMTDIHKNDDKDGSPLSPPPLDVLKETIPCSQCSSTDTVSVNHQNVTIEDTRSGDHDLMMEMPALKLLPHFYTNEWTKDDLSLPPLPALKPLPDLITYGTIYSEPNHSTIDMNVCFQTNEVINNVFNQSDENIFDSNIVSDLDRIIREMPEILDSFEAITTPIIVSDMSSLVSNSCVDSVRVTQNCDSNSNSTQINVCNDSNSDHNFVDKTQSSVVCENSSKANQSMNESIVSIDLSDVSNSPQSANEFISSKQMPISDKPIASNSAIHSLQRRTTSTKTKYTDNRLENKISKQSTAQNSKRSPLEVKSMVAINYCANDWRYFNLTRHSARHKASTQNGEFDYENDMLANASWDQIDGSQYEAKVNKWSEEDMDEDKRKDILRNVELNQFVKSVYETDRNVFYCWNAFEGQSIQSAIQGCLLKCLMRLDPNGVKRQRFTKHQTRLFLLCGSAMVITENGKQRKSVEVGQEVMVPPHTRFEVENRGVESSYFYVIVSNR